MTIQDMIEKLEGNPSRATVRWVRQELKEIDAAIETVRGLAREVLDSHELSEEKATALDRLLIRAANFQ